MAYLGNGPLLGAYTHVDDISSGFNGTDVTFNLTKNSVAKYPVRAENILVSIDGVFQEPYESYDVINNTITFTEAPVSGSSFFAVILGNVLNIGAIPDGVVTADKMGTDAIDTAQIIDDAVTSAKINDGSITLAKLESSVASSITSSSLPLIGGTMSGDINMGSNDITAVVDISASGTVTAFKFNATSDATLKEDITLLENPLDKISQLNGYSFKWKQNKTKSIGILAQEVEKVFPEMVETGNDGYKRVNYDALVPVLIEAIKELSKKIKD